MDQQRIQDYLYLIQELLRCSPGSEETVLKDRPDLLDAGLVEMTKKMAAAEKNRDVANRLKELANQVDEKLNPRNHSENSFDKGRLNFLLHVLQAMTVLKLSTHYCKQT